jgi:hypothetical protein
MPCDMVASPDVQVWHKQVDPGLLRHRSPPQE